MRPMKSGPIFVPDVPEDAVRRVAPGAVVFIRKREFCAGCWVDLANHVIVWCLVEVEIKPPIGVVAVGAEATCRIAV